MSTPKKDEKTCWGSANANGPQKTDFGVQRAHSRAYSALLVSRAGWQGLSAQNGPFCAGFPTRLAAVGVDVPQHIEIDGINALPVLRGEGGRVETQRFWQWNRYTPLVTSNAATRDGDWKLVRPAIPAAMQVPDVHWLWVSMYGPEFFIRNGVLRGPEPQREVPPAPAPELYNIAEDPLERENLADKYPERVRKLLRDLENWFEQVEADRATIDDIW